MIPLQRIDQHFAGLTVVASDTIVVTFTGRQIPEGRSDSSASAIPSSSLASRTNHSLTWLTKVT